MQIKSDKIEMQLTLSDYTIYIKSVNAQLIHEIEARSYSRIFVLCDTNTAQYCLPILSKALDGKILNIIKIPAGELHKNIDTCQTIWTALMQGQADRKSLLLNLGGGVIGDMGGFCAATFKRGIDFMQIPTTLLSQVDASIGGKLGIDFGEIKNSVGIFCNPKAIFIDTRFLETLSARELRSGYAEILKHSLIADAEQWKRLSQNVTLKDLNWSTIIPESLKIKQQIVAQDPFEQNIRKGLNFGHTVGHAFESLALNTDTPLLHGEAIAEGMVAEAYLSYRLGTLSEQELESILLYINTLYKPMQRFTLNDYDALYALMLQDKKNEGDKIMFTTLRGIGNFDYNTQCNKTLIMESFDFFNESTNRFSKSF
jgi:3-dehydroquinate synthase